MNQKEWQIVSHLRKNAQCSLASISANTNIPISTVHDKTKKLQNDNIITRYTTLIDFKKLGFHHHTKVAIEVTKSQRSDFILYLKTRQCINSLFEINGGFDVMIETIHKNIKEHIAFMDELHEAFDIIQLKEFQVIQPILQESFNHHPNSN